MVVMGKKFKKYYAGIVILVILVVAALIIMNRVWIYDWYRGITYSPTAEMLKIKNNLKLTSDGEFLFNAVQPVLNTATDFNENCKREESETAVLGCYTLGNIYVYNIVDNKLPGIRESTTAHELLHAVWARMSENEKEDLEITLWQVYKDNLSILKEDIDSYDEDERLEEIFVRAGTEIKRLPKALEEIYVRVFKNQDVVVDFYESYITVFKEIETQTEKLLNEINDLKGEIDEVRLEYNEKETLFEGDVTEFNNCAETPGCFTSEGEFYSVRNSLLLRRSELESINNDINTKINDYNNMVEEYNANVIENKKLQNIINSKVETVELE